MSSVHGTSRLHFGHVGHDEMMKLDEERIEPCLALCTQLLESAHYLHHGQLDGRDRGEARRCEGRQGDVKRIGESAGVQEV